MYSNLYLAMMFWLCLLLWVMVLRREDSPGGGVAALEVLNPRRFEQ